MEMLKQLKGILNSKSPNEILQEKDVLVSIINKLPRYILFFKEFEVNNFVFTTEENKYEIIRDNNTDYFVQDKFSKSIVPLPKKLEEIAYIQHGSFDLSDKITVN